MTYRVKLSNGEVLEIEEGDESVHISLIDDKCDYQSCICTITDKGVIVMPNSGSAVFYTCKGLKNETES